MTKDALTLFLDTNSLLHYPPIKDVDWLKVCDATEVKLVLCLQVIHELDEKKNDSRLSDRANRVIKEIRTLQKSSTPFREGVTVEVFNQDVKQSEFGGSLNPDSKDDRIVFLLKKYVEKNGEAQAAIYTEDLGMMLRCEANGIAVIEPDAGTRLENPKSEHEKKHRKVIAELETLKRQAPNLELVLMPESEKAPDKSQRLEFILDEPPPLQNSDEEVLTEDDKKEFFRKHKKEIAQIFSRPAKYFPPDVFKKNLEKREKYENDCKVWEKELANLKLVAAHSVRFSIWLCNDGGAPADDIDVQLIIKNVASLVCEDDFKEAALRHASNPSQPPKYIQNNYFRDLGIKLPSIDHNPVNDQIVKQSEEFLPSMYGPSIEEDKEEGKFTITLNRKRLKHGDNENLATLTVVLTPETVRPFEIDFRILAANQPKVQTGKIPVIVRREIKNTSIESRDRA